MRMEMVVLDADRAAQIMPGEIVLDGDTLDYIVADFKKQRLEYGPLPIFSTGGDYGPRVGMVFDLRRKGVQLTADIETTSDYMGCEFTMSVRVRPGTDNPMLVEGYHGIHVVLRVPFKPLKQVWDNQKNA